MTNSETSFFLTASFMHQAVLAAILEKNIDVYTLPAYLQVFHRYDCALGGHGKWWANGEAVSSPGLS